MSSNNLVFTHDALIIEEIQRKGWNNDISDNSIEDESAWDILNDSGDESCSHRHWFKQNFVETYPQNISIVTYH